MKQFFLVRWFREWRKKRIVDHAWDMRAYPPCVFCQRPIPERSSFCSYCGASQTVERNTSGQLPVKPAPVFVPVPTVLPTLPIPPMPVQPPPPPSLSAATASLAKSEPAIVRERDEGRPVIITNVLPYYRATTGKRPMKVFHDEILPKLHKQE